MTADKQFATGQLEKTVETPKPIEGSETASIGSVFSKMFSKQFKRTMSDAGEAAFEKRTATKLNVEPRAKELVEAEVEDFNPEADHQFNFEAINTAEDVKAEMGKMNEINREAINSQRRNVVPDVELKSVADDLSTDPEMIKKVLGLKPGEILPPEYILSMKQTLQQSGKRLTELSTKIANGLATDKDQIAFHKQWEFHSQFTTQFMGVRAEYGRGLRSLGIDVGSDDVPMDELMNRLSSGNLDTRNMAQQILNAADTKSIGQTVQAQKSFGQKTGDIAHEVFMGSILSGVQTHVVNMTGNAMKSMIMPLDTAVASLFKADGTNVIGKGEGAAQLRGMFESSIEGLQIAWKILKTGEAYGGTSKIDLDYNKALTANSLGIKEGTTLAWTVDAMGKTVRLATDNLMGAEDAFFKVVGERGKLRQLAHRKATEQKLEGKEYDNFIAYFMENPTATAKEEANTANTNDFTGVRTFGMRKQ
jgi:hypothetical protein